MPQYLQDNHNLNYRELCHAIKVVLITHKLKEIVHCHGPDSLIPKKKFILNIPGIKVSGEQQRRIFNLLQLTQITQVIALDKDSLNPSYDIVQVIIKKEITKHLCNVIIQSSYRDKMANILIEIDQLKELP